MSTNIQFDTDQHQFTQRTGNSGGMAAWLVKKGIIKDESQASSILIGIVIFNIILTILIIYFFLS